MTPVPSVGVPTLQKPHRGGTSIYMTIGILLFVVSLASVGAAYVWKQYLQTSQDQYKSELSAREQQFNIDQITQLKQINVQIDTARSLLSNHLALSQIFKIISHFTIDNIQFLSLDVTTPQAQGGDLAITMSGAGVNLAAVAFQSDVLGSLENYNLHNIVKNPIIANPSIDSKTGVVSFSFTADINPSALSYETLVTSTSSPY